MELARKSPQVSIKGCRVALYPACLLRFLYNQTPAGRVQDDQNQVTFHRRLTLNHLLHYLLQIMNFLGPEAPF